MLFQYRVHEAQALGLKKLVDKTGIEVHVMDQISLNIFLGIYFN